MNGQLQMGDVLSDQTLVVEESTEGVGGAALVVGNIVSATGAGAAIDIRSEQEISGHVESAVNATITGDGGPYLATSSDATGNSATFGASNAPTTGSSIQTIDQDSVIAGDAFASTGGTTAAVSIDSSAVGNTTGWEQAGGTVQSWTGQTNAGLTSATNTGELNTVTGNTGLSATAVGNNVTGDITNAATDIGVGQETAEQGATNAVIDMKIANAGDIQALASGVGNNVDVQGQGAWADMNVTQNNAGSVAAYANLDVTSWSGDANVTAYGVGNSIILSNAGPHVGLWNDQTANGDVNATASFTGGTGSTAYASATAIGNAVSGFVCNQCGGELIATNRQTGNSKVRSSSAVNITGKARQVAGDSTAIGNSATYQVVGSGN